MAKDNFDIDSLSKELDNQMSQLDKELNKQMEDISSQIEVTPKKHKYIIRLDGPMMQIDSMELPNATDDCIEEIWEEEGPFVDYVNDDLEALWYDAYDIEIEGGNVDEDVVSTFKELAGEVKTDNVRRSQYYLNVQKDYTISLHELTDDGEYQEIDGNLKVEIPFHLTHGANLQANIDCNLVTNEELLRELYKKNGFDESYNLSFMDENLKFIPGKWYLVNMKDYEYFQENKEYILETDEEFDITKLIGIDARIECSDDCNSFLTGLFYGGKLLPLHHDAEDDGDASVQNYLIRYEDMGEEEGGLRIYDSFPDLTYL